MKYQGELMAPNPRLFALHRYLQRELGLTRDRLSMSIQPNVVTFHLDRRRSIAAHRLAFNEPVFEPQNNPIYRALVEFLRAHIALASL